MPSPSSPSSSVSEAKIYVAHVEGWLSRDDQMSLAITLHYALVELHDLPSNEVANLTASFLGKSERTVREWRHAFVENNGSFPESQQGGKVSCGRMKN